MLWTNKKHWEVVCRTHVLFLSFRLKRQIIHLSLSLNMELLWICLLLEMTVMSAAARGERKTQTSSGIRVTLWKHSKVNLCSSIYSFFLLWLLLSWYSHKSFLFLCVCVQGKKSLLHLLPLLVCRFLKCVQILVLG